MLRGSASARQLLSRSQERALWEEVLEDLAGDGPSLSAHAAGLNRAAERATQSLLALSRSAQSEEELLLAQALAEVRRRCAERGVLALRLASPEQLHFLREVAAPAIAGEPRLTPLQESVQRECWPDAALLLPQPAAEPTIPALRRFTGPDAELAACAQWCLDRLRADGAARLLVISACAEPSLAIQGELLWRQLAGAAHDTAGTRSQLLAVEGGEPLDHLALIADALLALQCLAPQLDTEQLYALLRSPYLRFGSADELWSLQGCFQKWALARWSSHALREALASVAARQPAAARLLAWLEQLRELAGRATLRSATEWAQGFTDMLAAAGFHLQQGLDSREQQRFRRWGELLDEFASLDAVLPPLGAMEALRRLGQLAGEGRHQPASGDAAITLSGVLADPVAGYDGIWVLGLAESRWPAPPRPDAYVALREQRQHHWPESGVTQRRAQALWALSCWQRRTRELVLSYPEMEADLHHRPTALLEKSAAEWSAGADMIAPPALGLAMPATDQQFPPLAPSQEKPLPGGERRLSVQQQCAFRAQAQWRLHARAADPLSDGITAPLRGTLLHLLLQGLWGELRDQAQLLALQPADERALLERQWQAAMSGEVMASARWWPAGLRERERERTLTLVAEVLHMERKRGPFTVQQRELRVPWIAPAARMNLRIDRIDRLPDGTHMLVDYKTGAAGRMKLHEGELEPLQLALYVAALAAQGELVSAAALFSLKPGETGFAGVGAAGDGLMPGLKPVEDWPSQAMQWQQRLLQLLSNHFSGDGTLASDPAACRHCHLPALCRRAALEDLEESGE